MLFPPVLLYKVSTEDGHEELTRGGSFSNVSTRVLREIDSTADDAKAYPTTSGQQINSIIAPS
jgi:flagellar basal body rod protein FlgG